MPCVLGSAHYRQALVRGYQSYQLQDGHTKPSGANTAQVPPNHTTQATRAHRSKTVRAFVPHRLLMWSTEELFSVLTIRCYHSFPRFCLGAVSLLVNLQCRTETVCEVRTVAYSSHGGKGTFQKRKTAVATGAYGLRAIRHARQSDRLSETNGENQETEINRGHVARIRKRATDAIKG